MAKVIVLGAGIGGMTAAHQLIKHGHEVIVYERNPATGGLARSRFNPDGGFSEYCIHIVGSGYQHLLSLFSEIPTDISENQKTVKDHLEPISFYFFGAKGDFLHIDRGNAFVNSTSIPKMRNAFKSFKTPFSIRELAKLISLQLFIKTTPAEQFDQYDDQYYEQLMEDLNPELKKWIIDPTSNILGLQPHKISTHTILEVLRSSIDIRVDGKGFPFSDSIPIFYMFDGPIHEIWFQSWKTHLEKQGVKFHMNTTIQKINCLEGSINSIEVEGSETPITGDYYINGLGVEVLPRLLNGAPKLENNMGKLAALGRQVQNHVIFRFNEKFQYEGPTVLYFPDSPWALLACAEGSFWKTPMGNETKDMIAVGIGVFNRKGILFDKTADECTPEELAQEAWAQMKQAKGLFTTMKTESGTPIDELEYESADIWHSFFFNKKTQQLDTWEPKFSNNVGTLRLRPTTQDPDISNLVHATGYTKTEANIFNMESAAEAGYRAANYILSGVATPEFPRFAPPALPWKMAQKTMQGLAKVGVGNPFEYLMNKL